MDQGTSWRLLTAFSHEGGDGTVHQVDTKSAAMPDPFPDSGLLVTPPSRCDRCGATDAEWRILGFVNFMDR